MTRKYALLFVFTTVFLFTITSGIFGKQGYLRNSGLKRQLEQQLHQEELLRLQVHSLERRKESVDSVDELRDAALRLGYNQDGNQVFYFSDDRPVASATEEVSPKDGASVEPYPGIPAPLLAVYSVAGAVAVVLFALLLRHLRIRKFRKEGDERGGYYEF
jgi:cell division protein FtsB